MTKCEIADAKGSVKKVKVAIINHEIYPVLSGGAIYIEKIANELGQLGYDVDILSQRIGSHLPFEEVKNHYRIIRLWTGRKSRGNATALEHLFFILFALPQMLFYIKRNRIDISLCLFAIPAGLFGFVTKLITRTPYITIVDGADMPSIKSDMSRFVVLLKPIFRAVTKNSDAVVLLEGLEDMALPLVKNKNIYILTAGVDIPVDMAQPCKRNDRVLRMLSIGRLSSRKGFDLIVEACRLAKQSNNNFHLNIIGYGKEEASIASAIIDYGLQDNITLVGRVEYDQLPGYYLDSDCYIFFGDREGQSLAMIDAVAYGLPVICSNHPGNTTFVVNGINGFAIDHPNVEQLSRAIVDSMENYDKLPEMGRKSRSIAAEHSWRSVAINYKSIIDKVLSARV